MHTSVYIQVIAHYIAKVVTEEERKEGNLDPTTAPQTNKLKLTAVLFTALLAHLFLLPR